MELELELELDELLELEELLELDDVSLLFFSVELELEESADGLVVLGFVPFLPERESVR